MPRAVCFFSPQTGEIAFWSAGIDGQTPVDLDDLDWSAPIPAVLGLVPGHGRLRRRHHRWARRASWMLNCELLSAANGPSLS